MDYTRNNNRVFESELNETEWNDMINDSEKTSAWVKQTLQEEISDRFATISSYIENFLTLFPEEAAKFESCRTLDIQFE